MNIEQVNKRETSLTNNRNFSLRSIIGNLDNILPDDKSKLTLLGITIENNYNITNNITVPQKYIYTELTPEKREELIEVDDDEILRVVHDHLTKLNDDLTKLHERVTERLDHIESLEKERKNV